MLGSVSPHCGVHFLNFHNFCQNWGESHILEEMYQKGRLGPAAGVTGFAVVQDGFHNEFSDMCMLTPLWLARGTGVTGPRNPLETAREIEEHTWKFVSAVLQK